MKSLFQKKNEINDKLIKINNDLNSFSSKKKNIVALAKALKEEISIIYS